MNEAQRSEESGDEGANLTGLLCVDPRPLEVKWYKENGRYPERIVKPKIGGEYVIGDFSWNRKHKNKPEFIEPYMSYYVNNQDLFCGA